MVRRQKRPHLDRARDLRKLLDMYAVTDESQREGYFAMAREGKQRAWWQSYGDVIPSEYGTLIGLESEAATISNYEQELIPGLLQTEDYGRAVIRVSGPTTPPSRSPAVPKSGRPGSRSSPGTTRPGSGRSSTRRPCGGWSAAPR